VTAGSPGWNEASSSALRPAVDLVSLSFILLELAVAASAVVWAVWAWEPLPVVVAMVVVATRQHALFILFHDAVHFLVARNRRLNDLITNGLIGVPQLVPVQLYRRLHLTHHARLGTGGDPERLLLYRAQPWQYEPLSLFGLLRQVLGDLLLVNTIKTLWFFERERRGPRLELPRVKTWPEFYALVATYLGLVVAAFALEPELAARVLFVWLVPLLTLTQAIQKVRSFLEHAPMSHAELTYSWRPGLLGRLTLWPYCINYHREHHLQPRVPWHELPRRFAEQRPTQTTPWRVLWNGRLIGAQRDIGRDG
jgi:fatty acid desaturase